MHLIQSVREFLKNLNLFYKFQVAMFIVSIVTLSVMGYFGYTEGQKLLSQRSFDLLINITENKRKAIEGFFQNIERQILTLAQNPSTSEALEAFKNAFKNQTTDLIPQADSVLRKFYQKDFIDVLKYNTLQKEIRDEFTPTLPNEIALQYKYIAANTYPIGYKENLPFSKLNEEYDQVHQKYHLSFLNYKKNFDHEDLLLLDTRGNVVYSVAKKVEFARNVLIGPYRNSNVGRLFERVIRKREERKVFFEDYEPYLPALGSPKSFVATPIYDTDGKDVENAKILGVLIFQISTDKITEILTNNQQWVEDGLGVSGETALFGADYKVRNNTRRFLEDALAYQQSLLAGGVDSILVEKIKRLKTTILLRERKNQVIIEALAGKRGSNTTIDYLGTEVLDVYMPVDFLGNRWAIFTEMNSSEMFSASIQFQRRLLLVAIILFISITLLGLFLANSLAQPMRKIQREITMLSEGNFPKISPKIYKDELGKIDQALNTLIINMKDVAEFAENIGKGNFDYDFKPKGKRDILGTALLQMRDNLKKVSIEEQERNWLNIGKADFSEILRNNNQSIEQLAEAVIASIVKYLKATQGAFFIYDETENILKAVSTYAYEKYKYNQKAIAPGEGLVGQVFLEKDKIYLTEIPENYSKITSGLGKAKPRSILIIPIKINRQVYGVIEIASLEQFQAHEISFLDSISDDIATTITSIKNNEETRRLLQESQKAEQQLKQQEEEMRQNFEELMATQEEMKRRQEQLDLLLHGKINLDELENIEFEKGLPWDDDSLKIENRVQKAILRQKLMLDKASQINQKKEEFIRNKVDKINGQEKKS